MRARFGVKLAAIFGISTILICAFTIAMFYRQAIGAMNRELETKMLQVAVSASCLVEPSAHAQVKTRNDQNTEAYRAIKAKLQKYLNSSTEIRHIYTLTKDEQGNIHYVFDVGDKPPILAYVGSPWAGTSDKAVKRIFENKSANVSEIVREDKWGKYKCAFAPIMDRKRNIIAVLGVDMSVEHSAAQQQAITYAAIVSLLTAVILALLLSAGVSSRISSPILQLTAATRDIAHGNLDCMLEIDTSDEIGSLAASFNHMLASLKESQNALQSQANTDGLTGLYNHRYFHERLGQELKRSVRYGRSLSLIMIDLDGFKSVNDKMGHPAGDTILRNVSKVINTNIREIDIAVRYGGDEFAVILPETDLDEAKALAERMRQAIDESPALTAGEKAESAQWKITLSIGVASYPKHSRQRDALVAAADIAMYHAKNISQNRVCTYDEVPGAGSTMDPSRLSAFLQSASVSTIAALAEAVDVKDHYTHGHSESVARYATAIADQLRLSPEEKFNVRIAALLHDVGKIGVPETILQNPGALSTEQKEIIRNHPSVGGKIVKQIPQLQKILPGIVYHHERYDGKGYPNGIAGEKIPLIARIICVADSFDAMTSDRPYRRAMSVETALAELRDGIGRQFDGQVVQALINWLKSVDLKAA